MGVFASGLRERKRSGKEARFANFPKPYSGPVIVADGDSWFEYPWQTDTIQVLGETYRIKPLARAGDTWNDVRAEQQLMPTIRDVGPDIVLLSVGGNDIIDHLPVFVFPYTAARAHTGRAYVRWPVYRAALDVIVKTYDEICRPIVDLGVDVVVSGYDRPNPRVKEDGGQWIGPELIRTRKLFDIPLWHLITAEMIDEYDRRMRAFAARFNAATDRAKSTAKLTFVSQIDAVNDGSWAPHPGSVNPRWNDEMHPTDEGFRRVAGRLARAIDDVWKRRNTPTV